MPTAFFNYRSILLKLIPPGAVEKVIVLQDRFSGFIFID